MTQDTLIEARARKLYEASRRNVSGRPAWEALDPNDRYDMGMRSVALDKARSGLGSSLADKAKALAAHLGGDSDRITVVVGDEQLHVHARGRRPARDRVHEWDGVAVEWHAGAAPRQEAVV